MAEIYIIVHCNIVSFNMKHISFLCDIFIKKKVEIHEKSANVLVPQILQNISAIAKGRYCVISLNNHTSSFHFRKVFFFK